MMRQSVPTLSPFSMLAGMRPVASGICSGGNSEAKRSARQPYGVCHALQLCTQRYTERTSVQTCMCHSDISGELPTASYVYYRQCAGTRHTPRNP